MQRKVSYEAVLYVDVEPRNPDIDYSDEDLRKTMSGGLKAFVSEWKDSNFTRPSQSYNITLADDVAVVKVSWKER